MKIICVAKNYPQHVAEMQLAEPALHRSVSLEQPWWFLKPDSALLQNHRPFFLPDFSNDVQHEVELVVRIDRVGKSIEERFAHRYYHEVTVGIDFTARDLQRQAKSQGMPWTLSKGFDGSAVLGDFVDLDSIGGNIHQLNFALAKNGVEVQHGNTSQMLHDVDRLISHISDFMTLKTGDLLFTGTPHGVGAVAIGDVLEASLQGRKLLTCRVK